jgi:hypothetical protein
MENAHYNNINAISGTRIRDRTQYSNSTEMMNAVGLRTL